MDKAPVEQALLRLASFLTAKGAHVHAAYLPSADGGKVGVDDYLLSHTVTELEHGDFCISPRKGIFQHPTANVGVTGT
jgi:hypothetical protein